MGGRIAGAFRSGAGGQLRRGTTAKEAPSLPTSGVDASVDEGGADQRLAKPLAWSGVDPGRVKTTKGRSRRGFVFYQSRGFRPALSPLASALGLAKKIVPSVLNFPAFRPRPLGDVGCQHVLRCSIPRRNRLRTEIVCTSLAGLQQGSLHEVA